MLNYEAAVACDAGLIRRPLCLVGWSMGGLAAMMAARRVRPDALVLLEPSPPAEIQGVDETVVPEEGTFDPESVYGPFPSGRARPDSRLARAERKRGVSVPALECPTLVVYGDEFAGQRGGPVAAFYGAEEAHVAGASHWDLVLGDRARSAVGAWAEAHCSRSTG